MLSLPPLYPIVNSISEAQTKSEVESLLSSGAQILQLRAKSIEKSELKRVVHEALKLRDRLASTCKILVNDHHEIASQSGADGVHLGRADASSEAGEFATLEEARKILGDESIIGLSNHSKQQIENAPHELLSYLALGPIFKSNTKSGHASEVGLQELRLASKTSKLPIVAIGGINRRRIAETLRCGASSCAMIETFLVEDQKSLFSEFAS